MVASCCLGAWSAQAATGSGPSTGATEADAVAMVKKGTAFIKSYGTQRGYTDISRRSGRFAFQNLYLVVMRIDGTMLAHGADDRSVGRNVLDMKDSDGRPFIRQQVGLAATRSSFWVHFRMRDERNPRSELKSSYCEKLDDTLVCGVLDL